MKIGVLGPLEVFDDPGPIEISGARLRLLLTVLALEAPRPVSAGALVEALWGDEPPADQANALQSLTSRLRKALGDPELVKQSAAGYRLSIDAADVDLHRFTQLADLGRQALRAEDPRTAAELLSESLALWRGDALDIAASEHGHPILSQLDERRLEAHTDLIEARLAIGDAAAVITDLDRLVDAHPERERLVGLQIQALYAVGRQADALASYERLRTRLADELGVDPSAELQAIHLAVLRGEPAAAATSPTRRSNLRSALTTFVGRDAQLAQIAEQLTTSRLVTLVGPGGAGKTRLAGEAAAAKPVDTPDGVWLIELAPVTDPADVPQTVLGSLGLRETMLIERASHTAALDPMTRLVSTLAERSLLLVLDNCEHLIDAAATLSDELLARCPDLRIIATSREPLGITGESLVVVPPLGQPAPEADAEQALEFPAVQLFIDRAADVQPGFTLEAANVAVVIEIVRRLDGQPLAIELAAARLRSLPIEEIALRLSDRFRLLTGGSRTAMPRHRTLRAVVEWSWDLLSDDERMLAERLAVFTGGVTPAAAAAVCAGDELDARVVDDLLASLVDKSLLTIVPTPTPRFRMLETIREFGVERMAARDEVGTIRAAHARHFAALVAEADPHLRRAEQLEWMAVLTTERDNILAGLKFFADDGNAAAALELATMLGWYWMTSGGHGETVTWMTVALETRGESDPGLRLLAEAYLAINTIAADTENRPDAVETHMHRLKEVGRRVAEAPDDGPAMLTLFAPVVASFIEDDDRAKALSDRALLHEDPWIRAAVLTFRASIAENNGDVAGMRYDAETSLATFRELGERWGMANSLQVLGQLELVEGNLAAAAAAYHEGIDLAHQIGGREDAAMMRLRLAEVYARQGDMVRAREQAKLTVEESQRSGTSLEVMFTGIAQLELSRLAGDLDGARRDSDAVIADIQRLPEPHPVRSHGLALILATAAKLDLDRGNVEGAQEVLTEAYRLAVASKDMPIIAAVGVAVAMVETARGNLASAAEILGASTQLRGADDFTQLDVRALSDQLGSLVDGPHAAAYLTGKSKSRDDAAARVDPGWTS